MVDLQVDVMDWKNKKSVLYPDTGRKYDTDDTKRLRSGMCLAFHILSGACLLFWVGFSCY